MKKSYRIKKETEFQKIMQLKNTFANRNFVIYIEPFDQKHFRVGLSVGKKIGNAVTRNYIKRVIRNNLNQLDSQINQNYNVIIIARPNIVNLSFEEIKKNLLHVFKLANILKKVE
ncbi:ribonuclease P protein component [Vagococcus coleopterorum]|uniref:Ribonuclease P protein component n=1 Tax=Vagococcus coleopterorum TaxID=2714946 RepID=A0A6G8ALX5_9ENTE|nr:ribonuclease P protein component [Vagococcus coleopterorum]QIL45997.1 ribonuclease P protein component [Vagococcus coleopterorum]